MSSAKEVYFSSERTDLVESSAVNTLAVVEKPSSYNELLKLVHTFGDFCLSVFFGIKLFKVSIYIIIYNFKSFISYSLVVCIKSCSYLFNCIFAYCVIKVVVNFA